MVQDYSSHGVVFNKDYIGIAIVDDPGHAGKKPGLTFPGGRPKPKDKNNPLETFYREVRMETGIPRKSLELIAVLRDGIEKKIPPNNCDACHAEDLTLKPFGVFKCSQCQKEIPLKTVLQYVYLAHALSDGIADLKINGETNGWFWAPFEPKGPPEARGKRLYATYRNLWHDERFLELTEPLYHKSWERWHNRRAAQK